MNINAQLVTELLNINGYITVNKTLIKKLGLTEAVILGELIAEYKYWSDSNALEDDMFYSTQENIEENTGISSHAQRKAINSLIEMELIIKHKKGMPAKNYFKIDFDKLVKILTTSDSNFKEQVVENININNNKYKKNNKKEITNSKELVENQKLSTTTVYWEGGTKAIVTCQEDNLYNKEKSLSFRKNLYEKCLDEIYLKYQDFELQQKLQEYLKLRLEIKDKPIYYNQWKGILNKLDTLAKTNNEKIKIINQSIERGYASFFPINNYARTKDVTQLPWNKNVQSISYTEEELNELDKQEQELNKNGIKTRF